MHRVLPSIQLYVCARLFPWVFLSEQLSADWILLDKISQSSCTQTSLSAENLGDHIDFVRSGSSSISASPPKGDSFHD